MARYANGTQIRMLKKPPPENMKLSTTGKKVFLSNNVSQHSTEKDQGKAMQATNEGSKTCRNICATLSRETRSK